MTLAADPSSPRFEVELKFPLLETAQVRAQLASLGAAWSEPVVQRDCYFAHPVRKFAETDEALRTRSVSDQTTLTYKGPVIDRATKTRREIEVDLQPDIRQAAALTEILQHLSFTPVREVVKTRRTAAIPWQGETIHCGWDELAGLGTFLELEIVTDSARVPDAQQHVLSLAKHLQLPAPEPRSYLELLLAQDTNSPLSPPGISP